MKRWLHLLPLIVSLACARADESTDAAALERFHNGTFDTQTLAEVLPRLADPAERAAIRETLANADKPPHKVLVALLDHPLLAVRLGALELLEEAAGGDLSYNPWAEADSPENTAALARWSAWADKPQIRGKSDGIFSREQRRAYLQDILGDDADKAIRARRMLEAEGLPAVGFLEDYILETPALGTGHRARVREAQYQIVLARQLGDQAAVTARHLCFGSRDQILSALTTVRAAGLLALPILRDFITHPDPLIRENAMDSLLVTGGEAAVAIIAPLLSEEPDVNVIHGALRRLKDVPGNASSDLVASFLTHPDEDLLISAIQTSLSLTGNSSEPFSSSRSEKAESPADALVVAALADPRWRVRSTALEYITKSSLSSAKDACLGLLDDPDDFVRFAAIKAVATLGAKEAIPRLEALFAKDESMAGPVIEGFAALKHTPGEPFLTKLDAASPEARLAAIRAFKTSEALRRLNLRYIEDPNLDVACAALREIAGNSEQLEQAAGASAIVAALQSETPEKTRAVLDAIRLPKSKHADSSLMESIDLALADSEPTALDALYDAFLTPGRKTKKAKAAPVIPGAQRKLIARLEALCAPEQAADLRFQAALALAAANHAAGFTALLRDLPSLTTAQKTSIADGLYEPSVREAVPLIEALLRDPIPEVRKGAAEAALSDEKAAALISIVLNELGTPGSPLQPWEIYNYRFESVVRDRGASSRQLAKWALGVIKSPDTPPALKVLATIALRPRGSSAATKQLAALTTSPDPLLRRAALHTLGSIRPSEITQRAAAIAADPEALVRVVLPLSLHAGDTTWNHHFSNLQVVSDSRWSGQDRKTRLTDPLKQTLSQLAGHDPSELVRFEAAFTLLSHGDAIHLAELTALVPRLSEDTAARRRVTKWLSENAKRATPALRPLLGVIDPSKVQADKMKILNERINPQGTDGFTTFAALARKQPTTDESGGSALAEPAATGPVDRKSLQIVYFHKPGCAECAEVRDFLATLRDDFPLLEIHEHNLLEATSTVFNQALCQRFSVPSADHTLSPAVFCQGGFLIRDAISPRTLAELFRKTMEMSDDDSWMHMDSAEQSAAAGAVESRYAAFTLPVVIGAGLLDGINPCAFATIIFFLSYLQIARRTPREMLMVGAAFILAVFIAYFAAGLVLHHSIAALSDRFTGIRTWMNYGFATLALTAALLSFRDARRARRGHMDEMTLQLPGIFKDRIRRIVRHGARARWFVSAAFLSGLAVSVLELACTGQVYAPIIYQIQRGRLDAMLWLTIYNLAFIAPLVVIFLLAYGGMRSENLIAFQKKHTAAVKTGLGLLFLALAALILLLAR